MSNVKLRRKILHSLETNILQLHGPPSPTHGASHLSHHEDGFLTGATNTARRGMAWPKWPSRMTWDDVSGRSVALNQVFVSHWPASRAASSRAASGS